MLTRLVRLASLSAASVLLALAYNVFFLPHRLLSGGVTGLAMVGGHLTGLNTGALILVLNAPIFALGVWKLGRRFVAKSVMALGILTLAMQLIPVRAVTDDPILAAVSGGVLAGLSLGLILRAGGSTGGFDILGTVLTRKRDFPLGELIFAMNAVVVLVAGFFFTWELALYTLLTMFVTSKVIDVIHTRHVKLTLWIVTSEGEALKRRLLAGSTRGVTVVEAEGAYSSAHRQMLVTVVTRVEYEEIKRTIRETDPKAFVNVTQTVEVLGLFNRDVEGRAPKASRSARTAVHAPVPSAAAETTAPTQLTLPAPLVPAAGAVRRTA